jgi:threonine dehydrogenase-like Zn-dependent dehydrogenase
VGQRVVCAFNIACGKCEFCQREEYSTCKVTNPSNLEEALFGHRTSAIFGYSHLTGGVPGGQSEYVRVPFADTNLLAIPDELPDEKALFLSDIVPTALFGVQMGHVKKGDTVGIWGLGPVGLLVAKWCQLMGASRIIGMKLDGFGLD